MPPAPPESDVQTLLPSISLPPAPSPSFVLASPNCQNSASRDILSHKRHLHIGRHHNGSDVRAPDVSGAVQGNPPVFALRLLENEMSALALSGGLEVQGYTRKDDRNAHKADRSRRPSMKGCSTTSAILSAK